VWQLVRRRGTDEVFALKTMSKGKLIEARKVQNAINEKRILDMLEHPFCNSLATVFSDADPGGDVHVRCRPCCAHAAPMLRPYGYCTLATAP
jgi:proteasome assembly chaperone (PAC2) family protein